MVYIIDTSSFIRLMEQLLDELAQIIIEWFEQSYHNNIIISIEQVRLELMPGMDELQKWAATKPDIFEQLPDDYELTVDRVYEATLLEAKEYEDPVPKIDEFFDGADPYLIAKAIIDDGCVVTEEAPLKRGKIQIPQVCKRMGVRCINTDTMLAELDPEYSEVPLSIVRRKTDSVNPS